MSKTLIINSAKDAYRIALLEDRELIEYHIDKKDKKFTIGDIYLGTVKKIVPGLNAAFIDIGYSKEGFLHYADLGLQFNSQIKFVQQLLDTKPKSYQLNKFTLAEDLDKEGKIVDLLTKDQKIFVQIVKEPISSKGPRLSCEISIAGKYMILIPFSNVIHTSKRIEKEEKKRLSRLVASIKPKNFGIIIRTAAKEKDVAELDKDLQEMLHRWGKGMKKFQTKIPKEKVIEEVNRTSSILRDMLYTPFDYIFVDEKKIYEEIILFFQNIDSSQAKNVKLYKNKNKIFEHFSVERQIQLLFGQTVTLPGGGYLIIEHTEAMHVIDINSGRNASKAEDQEETAFNVNQAAVKEIARQLRLRDIGGIIVIDFIDMKQEENILHIYQIMKDHMKEDRVKVNILPISKFGIMQITRQRIRPEVIVSTKESCPTCHNKGEIDATLLITDRIEKNLAVLLKKQLEKNLVLYVHPFIFAFFTKSIYSKQIQWLIQYKKWVSLKQDSALGITEFKFLNKQNKEVVLR